MSGHHKFSQLTESFSDERKEKIQQEKVRIGAEIKTLEDALIEIERAVYLASVDIYENLEHQKLIVGNGHHAAQKIALLAKEDLHQRWKADKIGK